MDAGTLTLIAGQASSMDFSGIDCSAFTLQSQDDITSPAADTVVHTHNIRSCTASRPPGRGLTAVQLQLSEDDVDAIKLDRLLATGAGSSFLVVAASNGFVDSTSRAPLASVPSNQALQAKTYDGDTTNPNVVSFSLFDLDNGELRLSFDEPVDMTASLSLAGANLRLQHHVDATATVEVFDVASGTVVGGNGRNATIALTSSELNRLKLKRRVCSSIADCWLTIASSLVTDMARNPVVPLVNGVVSTVRLLDTFTVDSTGPRLTNSILNMSSGQLVLDFDEPVDSSSVHGTGITVLAAPGSLTRRRLTGGQSISTDGTQVVLQLDSSDVNALKASELIANNRSDTFLAMDNTTVSDLALTPNKGQEISEVSARQVDTYVGDTIPPQVVSFSINFESRKLIVTFDEPVRASRTDMTRFALRSSRAQNAETYSFSGDGGIASSSDGLLVLEFSLSTTDLTTLKLNARLATGAPDTFLFSTSSGATVDMRYNPLAAIQLADAVPVPAVNYVINEIPPRLEKFSLNLNSGLLNMTFDDPVNGSRFRPDTVTLQNRAFVDVTDASSRFTFSTATNTRSGIDFTLVVNIARTDLNALKRLRNLARNASTTYLIMTANVVDDVFGVDAIAITNGNGLQVTEFVADTTPPTVDRVQLDMDAGTLKLEMSETVDLNTLDTSQIRLQVSHQCTSIIFCSFAVVTLG